MEPTEHFGIYFGCIQRLFKGGLVTGGVSYTDGGAAAPPTFSFATPTLCSATPSFVGFSGFLTLKGWYFAFAMQNCQICRYFVISVLIFVSLAYLNIQQMSHFAPPTFSEKLHLGVSPFNLTWVTFSATEGKVHPGQVKRHILPFQVEAALKYLVVPLTFAHDCRYYTYIP